MSLSTRREFLAVVGLLATFATGCSLTPAQAEQLKYKRDAVRGGNEETLAAALREQLEVLTKRGLTGPRPLVRLERLYSNSSPQTVTHIFLWKGVGDQIHESTAFSHGAVFRNVAEITFAEIPPDQKPTVSFVLDVKKLLAVRAEEAGVLDEKGRPMLSRNYTALDHPNPNQYISHSALTAIRFDMARDQIPALRVIDTNTTTRY